MTVTRPDGQEIHRMVWMDEEMEAKIRPMVDQVLQQCQEPQMQQALVTQLIEVIFGKVDDKDNISAQKQKAPINKMWGFQLK